MAGVRSRARRSPRTPRASFTSRVDLQISRGEVDPLPRARQRATFKVFEKPLLVSTLVELSRWFTVRTTPTMPTILEAITTICMVPDAAHQPCRFDSGTGRYAFSDVTSSAIDDRAAAERSTRSG